MNTFGSLFRVTSFGESHGKALGVVVDGMPSGVDFEKEVLLDFLKRRRPGGDLVSSRKECDEPQVLSGVFKEKTLGTPIALLFENENARSEDYENLSERRGHADKVWKEKYEHIDARGGGRSSGRETLGRVAAGALAKMFLQTQFPNLKVKACTKSIFNLFSDSISDELYFKNETDSLGFFEEALSKKAQKLLSQAKKEGQSYGGSVELRVFSCPESLGQPVFKKLKSELAKAIMSVGAVKSFSLGEEVDLSKVSGQDFHSMPLSVYGGILGGISTGETIKVLCEVKPTSSILDVAKKGRHDPCIVPRILVVLESMVWLVLMDLYLMRKVETD